MEKSFTESVTEIEEHLVENDYFPGYFLFALGFLIFLSILIPCLCSVRVEKDKRD
jgi:hypothetical protein